MRSFFATALLFPLASAFAGITGHYEVHGGNKGDNTTYTGTLVIEKEGDIYTSTWELSDGSSRGTGVQKDDYLALTFTGVDASNNPITGVQLYEINKDSLHGPWAIVGESTKGFEFAKKKCH